MCVGIISKNILLNLQDRYIPFKSSNKVKAVWMTNRALKSVKHKSKVYKKYKNSHHPAVKIANRTAIKEIKNLSIILKRS